MKKTYSEIVTNGDTALYNQVFQGATIESVGMTQEYTAQKSWMPVDGQDHNYTAKVEGGLTFILNRDGKRTKVILGYTELGEWIEAVEEL